MDADPTRKAQVPDAYDLVDIFKHCEAFVHSLSDPYNWCRRASIIPHQDPADYRRRYLTDDQLLTLVRLHHRVLMVDSNGIQLS